MRLMLALVVVSWSLPALAVPDMQATLGDGKGKTVGTAVLTAAPGGVRAQLTVTGLAPGPHGFHLHEAGVCTAPTFMSAGGHFNPQGKQHGLTNPKGPHVGDLPSLLVEATGTGTVSFLLPGATLEAGPGSLVAGAGTALVLHAQADDGKTDPAGNAGARIACGVVLPKS